MAKEKRAKRITRSTIRSVNKPLNPATTTSSRGRGQPNTFLQSEEKELARRYKLQRKKLKLKRLYKKVTVSLLF